MLPSPNEDSNPGPSAYKAAALAKLSYKGMFCVGEAGIEPAVPERLIYSQAGSPDPAPPKYT